MKIIEGDGVWATESRTCLCCTWKHVLLDVHGAVRALVGRQYDPTIDAECDILWEGYHESRRCSKGTYPESYSTKHTCVRRLCPHADDVVDESMKPSYVDHGIAQ